MSKHFRFFNGNRCAGFLLPLLLSCICFRVAAGAVPVELVNVDGQYLLYRGGQPYFIKGGGGKKYFDRLAEYGGNSVRTWGSENAGEILDQAHRLGLTVTLGLWVQHERHGFDYDDPVSVNSQLDKIRKVILQYRNHPALLMWGIGNEVNLNSRNPKVWDSIQAIARMVHELDGRHPTMTVLAGSPARDISHILQRCPDIEILGVNVYAGLEHTPATIRNAGWEGPYVVTEWGNDGYWEVSRTGWGASLEQTSVQKADAFMRRYLQVMDTDSERNLGGYVFLWGHTREKTPTWFGLFTESGEETRAVDVMRYLWTGVWPGNLAPSVSLPGLNSDEGTLEGLYVLPNESYRASVRVSDPDGDRIRLRWILRKEGGPAGQPVAEFAGSQGSATVDDGGLEFNAPEEPGGYRLYVYAYDGHNHVGTANIPFFVKDPDAVAGEVAESPVPSG